MLIVLQPGAPGRVRDSVPSRLGALAVAVLGLGGFVWAERRSAGSSFAVQPLRGDALRRGLRRPPFFSGAAMFGALVRVPLLVQWGRGTDATTAGLSLMTMSTGWSVGGLVAGQGPEPARLPHARARGGRPHGAWATWRSRSIPTSGGSGSWWSEGAIGVGMGLLSITLVVGVQTSHRARSPRRGDVGRPLLPQHGRDPGRGRDGGDR